MMVCCHSDDLLIITISRHMPYICCIIIFSRHCCWIKKLQALRFVKQSEFKKYLHGFCDPGSRLMFKFRSGTHGLNEELGRHRGREGKVECGNCGAECESSSCVVGVPSI